MQSGRARTRVRPRKREPEWMGKAGIRNNIRLEHLQTSRYRLILETLSGQPRGRDFAPEPSLSPRESRGARILLCFRRLRSIIDSPDYGEITYRLSTYRFQSRLLASSVVRHRQRTRSPALCGTRLAGRFADTRSISAQRDPDRCN